MNMKDFRHLNFDREETQVKFKELLTNLLIERPQLAPHFGKAINIGVKEKAITEKQAKVMRNILSDVLGELVDRSIEELADALDIDLNLIYNK